MDSGDVRKRKRNPRESANLLSLFTFSYTTDLIKRRYKNDFGEEDLYEVTSNCESKFCGDRLEKEWINENQNKKHPSLFKTLCKVFGWRYLSWGTFQLISEILKSVLEPNAVSNLVSYFQPGQTKLTKYDAYLNAGTLLFSNFFETIYFHNYDVFLYIIGIETRTSLCSLLFRKVLKISPTAVSKANLGNVVTLITKDVQQIKRTMLVYNDLWGFAFVCVVTCYLLYSRMGVISLAAAGLYVCVIPLEVFIGKLVNKLRTETSERTDERLQVTQEVLSATKIIKMYTWEDFFYTKINLSRKKEIAKMVLVFYLRMVLMLIGTVVSKVGLYLLIMGYIWMKQPPDASIVFFISAHFESLNKFFGFLLPESIGKLAEFSAALTRVQQVLVAEEIPQKTETQHSIKPYYVELKDVTIRIGDDDILSNVNFKADSGLTLVTGRVGCGKSTLLKTMLQEYPLNKGEVVCNGTVSYASQDPWCFPSTIKQNILFGNAFDQKRYQEVLKVCALQYDLRLLEKGDETILTDKGQNLSKGQQARINLARAIYKDSDIYLLDDCLSALDAHVHHFIFSQCIKEFLKDKICILVMQADNNLQDADSIFVLSKGQIKYSYNPKQKAEVDTKELLDSVVQTKEFLASERGDNFQSLETDKLLETEQATYKNIYEETLKKEAVSKSVYAKYITYGGGILLLVVVLGLIGSKQAAESYSEKLLSVWSDEKQTVLNIKSNITEVKDNTSKISKLEIAETQAHATFKTYTIMLAVSVVLELLKTYAFLDFCKRASIRIHKAMMRNILQAVMAFFDTHFIGNVLNRFSQDVINVDENLPFQLLSCLGTIIHVGGGVTLLVSVNPYFLIYVLITFGVMISFLRLYLPVARNLQRLEASTRSPMLGHLNAALEGMTTIRAYKAEQMVIDEYERHQNVFTSAHYTLLCFQYAFGFFMSLLAGVMVTMVVCSFILFETGATAGSIGLALTQVVALGGLVQGSVKSWADLENLMTATERTLEYTGLRTESKEGSIPKHWPNEGVITYEKVSLSYTNNQVILNNLSFKIESQQKIGIVGRTGAGKSSIISTIFRLYEVDGTITIDGTDIKTLPLNYLRKNLAIIPQDPVIFSGTIRSNLDPFDEFEDGDLWIALEKANLKGFVTKLDSEVTSNASNFSLGQKQMICLARAILGKSKIVILDEATANMDYETEMLIRNTIKNNFSDCTVLTIAHRLQSILDCDRVMVLDRGEIKEFDDPNVLLKIKDGIFNKMVQQGGTRYMRSTAGLTGNRYAYFQGHILKMFYSLLTD